MDYLGRLYQLKEGEVGGLIKLLKSKGMIIKEIPDSGYEIQYSDGRSATFLDKEGKAIIKDNSTIRGLFDEYGKSLGEM